MGREYRLRFDCSDPDTVLADLSRLEGTSRSADQQELLFGSPGAQKGWPHAILRLEPSGAYFCDNDGEGRTILGLVISRLLTRVQRVTIEEYEP